MLSWGRVVDLFVVPLPFYVPHSFHMPPLQIFSDLNAALF